MTTKIKDAAQYKQSLLGEGRKNVTWTMETFSTYVNLLYPHITVVSGQKWTNVLAKYQFVCSVHGEYKAKANRILLLTKGCCCMGCRSDIQKANAGIIRAPRATKEEKELAAKLRGEGMSYSKIAHQLGRSDHAIMCWLSPVFKERHRVSSAEWISENYERSRANVKRHKTEFEHGRASNNATTATYRVQKTNTPEFVFIDNEWCEVDRKETYRIHKDYLLPPSEKKAIQELYLECQHITEKTGIEHHIDHIQPLSKGGEHSMFNLQIIPASENLSKNNTFRPEDQQLLIQRLFNQ